jgi:hypothetical protein
VNPADPKEASSLDLRPVWRAAFPSYGAAWDAAIEMGIDVVQLEQNLSLTPTQRLEQHEEMMRTFELLHGAALTKQR